jgi:predicted small metal-binding protein
MLRSHPNTLKESLMIQRIATIGLTLLVTTVFISSAFGQEPKKDVKKDAKPAVVSDSKKQVKQETTKDAKRPATPPTMKAISCPQPGCGFWAKSHSARELRGIMKRHMKKYHKKELTLAQLKEMVRKHEGK